MKISQVMSADVRVCSPKDTLQKVAQIMDDIDAGALPVGENDRLVGMISDRDIVIRAVADGKGCDAKVRDIMSAEVRYCFEDEVTAHIARNMAEQQIRRLPVVDRDKRLVGIVALADLAVKEPESGNAAEALTEISEPA
jgi:CBS domain-containing protein